MAQTKFIVLKDALLNKTEKTSLLTKQVIVWEWIQYEIRMKTSLDDTSVNEWIKKWQNESVKQCIFGEKQKFEKPINRVDELLMLRK